jgi:hypothetical protein
MSRPFPVHPRGPRRRKRQAESLLFACPRVSPDWELAALRALMKPQTRGAIENRAATQRWPGGAAEAAIRSACREVRARLGYGPPLHFPASGDYWFAAEVSAAGAFEEAKGFALVVSARLPELWFVFGRLFLRGGRFYRRARGFKLNLVPASNVHLTRPVRAALRDLL